MSRRRPAASSDAAGGRAGTMVSELQAPAMATTTTKIDGEVFESHHQHKSSGVHHKGFDDGGGGYYSPRHYRRPPSRHQFSDQVFNQEVDQELEERLVRLELKLDRLLQDSCRTHQSRRLKECWKSEDSERKLADIGGSWETPTARRNAYEKSTSTKKSQVGYLPPHMRHNASSTFYEKFPSPTRSQIKEFTSNAKVQSVSRIRERPPSVRLNSFENSALSKDVLEGGSDDLKSQQDGHVILRTHTVEAIANLSVNSKVEKAVVDEGGIIVLADLARTMNKLVAEEAAGGLWNLSVREEHKAAIAAVGGVEALVALAQVSSNSSQGLQERAAGALWGLSVSEANSIAIGREGGVAHLIALARSEAEAFHETAAGALWNLSFNSGNALRIAFNSRLPSCSFESSSTVQVVSLVLDGRNSHSLTSSLYNIDVLQEAFTTTYSKSAQSGDEKTFKSGGLCSKAMKANFSYLKAEVFSLFQARPLFYQNELLVFDTFCIKRNYEIGLIGHMIDWFRWWEEYKGGVKNLKKVSVVVMMLNQWGFQWVCSVGSGPSTEWANFQFSKNFLVCHATSVQSKLSVNGELASATGKLGHEVDQNNDIGRREGSNSKIVCSRTFRRLMVASHSLILAVVEELGIVYVIWAAECMEYGSKAATLLLQSILDIFDYDGVNVEQSQLKWDLISSIFKCILDRPNFCKIFCEARGSTLITGGSLGDNSLRQMDRFFGCSDSNFESLLGEIEKEMTMADILKELGYRCTTDISHCKGMLFLFLPHSFQVTWWYGSLCVLG